MIAPPHTQVKAARARRDFERYVECVKPQYDLQWFHRILCREIQQWATTDQPYVLILQMPPGHAKSEYAKLACTWTHARDTDANLVYTSYAQRKAEEHLSGLQEIMDSDRYRSMFPKARIPVKGKSEGGARRTVNHHEMIDGEGHLAAVGMGGPITGGRYDVAVIDDPLKGPKEARSKKILEDQWRWYTRTLMTRKRPDRPMRILMLLTRWSLGDLAGRIQEEQPDRCKVVSFPALKEPGGDDRDPREVGEALWPAVEKREDLLEIKRLDPEGFESLYQQNPVPSGGTIVKKDDIRRWKQLPGLDGQWVQSWDLRAGGKSKQSSFAVGQLWFSPKSEPGNAYLIDQRRGRWDINETLSEMIDASQDSLWGRATTKLVEKKADGRAVIPMLQKKIAGIEPINPVGDKEARLQAVAPFFRSGNVYLPPDSAAEWAREWVHEITTFPGSKQDDQVDAASQAISHLLVGEADDDNDIYSGWVL